MGRLERLDNIIFPDTYGWKALIYMVPAVGVEPTRSQGTRDFESLSSLPNNTTISNIAFIHKSFFGKM